MRQRFLYAMFFAVLALFPRNQLLALSAIRGWTLSAGLGMLWGEARESVNLGPEVAHSTNNSYLSLLLWELKDIPMIMVKTRWDSGKIFGMELNFSAAIPGLPAGEMNDYDWFFTDRDWSHWSLSETTLRCGFSANTSVDFRVIDHGPLSFHLGLAALADYWYWSDILKEKIYSSTVSGITYPVPFDTSNRHDFRSITSSGNFGKNAVDYETGYFSLLSVFKLRIQNRLRFVEINARIGPALAITHDFHKLRNAGLGLRIYNLGIGLPWMDCSFAIGVHITQRFSLTFRGEIAWLNDIVSDTHYYYGNLKYRSSAKVAGNSGFFRGGMSVLLSWKFPALKNNSSKRNR